jgi:hypothetical protein
MGGPPPQGRPKVYGYNAQTGETITPRHPGEGPRPTSRGHQWDGPPGHSSRMTMPPPPPGIEHGAQQRYHPEASRPSLSSRFAPLGYPDSPYHPQPHHSPTEALSTQVATLEDRVQRLAEVLNGERLDNIRSNLDFTSYLLQLTGWLDDKQCKYTVDLSTLDGADPSICATRPARPARHAQPSEFRLSTAVRNADGVGRASQHGERRSTPRTELYVITCTPDNQTDRQTRRHIRSMAVRVRRPIRLIRLAPPRWPRTSRMVHTGTTPRIRCPRFTPPARTRPSRCTTIRSALLHGDAASVTDHSKAHRTGLGITHPRRMWWT